MASSQAPVAPRRGVGTLKNSQPQAAASRTQKINNAGRPDPAWLAFARKIPRKAYWTALLLVCALVLFTWRFSMLGETASLKLKVQHSFKAAEIVVFIDGESRYSGKLSGAAKRRFGLRDNAQGSFSHSFHLRPGAHVVRVQIKSPAEGYNESTELGVEFAANRERVLAVTADRRSASLRAASQTTEASATDATPSWYQSYFMSLSLTLSGTVVSMLFGYLVQQFIGLFRKGKPPDSIP